MVWASSSRMICLLFIFRLRFFLGDESIIVSELRGLLVKIDRRQSRNCLKAIILKADCPSPHFVFPSASGYQCIHSICTGSKGLTPIHQIYPRLCWLKIIV